MKKKNVAWLVTHDAYIDRRIFFFADVLQENGWSVKLFPSAYTDLAGDSDPEYVVRPLDWSLIKLYGLSVDELMPKERALMKRIIDAQEQYHAEHGCYAPNLEQLQISRKGEYKLETMGGRDGYIVSIRQGERCLVYSSSTQSTTVIPDRRVAALAREYERAISQADLRIVDEEGHVMHGDIVVGRAYGPQGKMLAAHCKTNDNGVWAFQDSPPSLYRGVPKPYGKLSEDELGGQRFDWTEFRKNVYDFSPILEQVRCSLKEERPDLVYVADLPTLPIGVMIKRAIGCKLIVDCHEWWYKQEQLWNHGMTERIAVSEKTEAELYPECDVCITVGKYLAQDMSACYRKDFHVIYSCMSADLRLQDWENEAVNGFWKQYGVPEGGRVAIFQGSLTSLRNLDNLARATKYLPEDCYLAVVGGGDYETEFRHILETEGNPDRVVMVGWVNQGELLRYTVNADLGVLPYAVVDEYFSYSVPNKLMEYFEAKLPILYDASMREISMVAGENHVGVGVDLKNPKVFGQTMAELLRDRDRLAKLRDNYAHCQGLFSFESQRKAFEEILKGLGIE